MVHETLGGKGVTIRERDSQKQIRIPDTKLPEMLAQLLSGAAPFA